MSDKSSKTQLCKIIYFDDESITDYLQLMSGGKLEKTTEFLHYFDSFLILRYYWKNYLI